MPVPFDAGVEVLDDFFVLKPTVFIVPAAGIRETCNARKND